MDVLINYEKGYESLSELPLEDLAKFALESENAPHHCEISLSLVSDEQIALLNEKYRGKDSPTDVLSFECDSVDDEDLLDQEVVALGDVVIAPDVARRQTDEYGTSFEQEMSLLLVHGILHLCGYDHVEDEEALEMEGREAEILRVWNSR